MISPDVFKVEIPNLNPLHPDYIEFWREQKKRIVEGYWSHGKWMPPKLYCYINFLPIKRNIGNSLVKYLALPSLRDIEWEIHYLWAEARGFSGFTGDDLYTCSRVVADYIEAGFEPDEYIRTYYPEVLKPDGTFKTYVPAREYMRKIFDRPLGSPLFKNENRNLIMLGSRGYGKDLAEDTIVYTWNGPRKISEVSVGDKVVNHLGQFVTVTNKFKFDDLQQYLVTFADGRTVECGAGHKWKVYIGMRFTNMKPYPAVLTTEQIADMLVSHKVSVKSIDAVATRCYDPNFERRHVYGIAYLTASFDDIGSAVDKVLDHLIYNNAEAALQAFREVYGDKIPVRNERDEKIVRKVAFNSGHTVSIEDGIATIEKREYIPIISIEPTSVRPSYCISVDGPDNLFIVNDSIPTHNSYTVAGIVTHEFITDGKTSIGENSLNSSSESMVVAGEAKYSSETLDKVRVMLNNLPGGVMLADTYYPPPFYKRYMGSFAPGKDIIAKYKKKIGGSWVDVGSMSTIKHRTFKDNQFAGNGTRPGTIIMEEIGLFPNLEDAFGSLVETQRDGAHKFGATFMIGTGGDMESGTIGAKKIFYSPEAYDCLVFEDIWEYRGKIGYFVPAYMGLNQFKDSYGNTNVEAAKSYLENIRKKLSEAKDGKSMLEKEMINRPIVPSEMFLQSKGAMFPVAELQRALAELEADEANHTWGMKVTLFFDSSKTEYNGVNYSVDVSNELQPINQFPWTSENREGCVVIYELPQIIDGRVPDDAYIIGYDPVASDRTSGDSLAAIHVVKTKKYAHLIGHDEIVATYFGRPYYGRNIVNDICLKLSLMYNAVVYFENMVGNVKEYFEKHGMLNRLASRPQTVLTKKASFEQAPTKEYGYPMSSRQFKLEGVSYLRDWLLEFRDEVDGRVRTNLDYIKCKYTLQQLIAFNMDGNFDAVMSLMGAIVGINERYNQYENSIAEDEFRRKLQQELDKILIHNPKLFR